MFTPQMRQPPPDEAPRRRKQRQPKFRVSAAVAILLSVVSCARPAGDGSGDDSQGEASPRACGAPLSSLILSEESQELLFGVGKRVIAAVDTFDAGVLMSVDSDVPDAGDDDTSEGRPSLVLLSSEGDLADVELPLVDGQRVAAAVLPLGTDSTGTTFLYESLRGRVLTVDQAWRWDVVLTIDPTLVAPRPTIAFGTQDEPYLALATQVIQLNVGRGLADAVVGRESRRTQDISFPELSPTQLDGQIDMEASLPLLTGLAVNQDDTMYFSSQQGVYMIGPDSVIKGLYARDGFAAGPASPGQDEPSEQSLFTGVAVSAAGEVLVMDTGRQRLVSVSADGHEQEVVSAVSSLNGPSLGSAPHRLLIGRNAGEGVCSFEPSPPGAGP